MRGVCGQILWLWLANDIVMFCPDRGVNLRGNVVGLAFVGTMCSSRNSVGLTQDRQAPASRVAITASHELGHIFNMDHDDGRKHIIYKT